MRDLIDKNKIVVLTGEENKVNGGFLIGSFQWNWLKTVKIKIYSDFFSEKNTNDYNHSKIHAQGSTTSQDWPWEPICNDFEKGLKISSFFKQFKFCYSKVNP